VKKTWIAAALGVLALGAYALAQVITVPTVTIVNPTDLIQIIPGGIPSAGNVYATPSQITSQSAYYKSVPLTLFTFTFANNQSVAAFRPAGTLAGGYVTFSPSPSDGAQQCVFSTQTITAFYPTANTGQTVNNAVTTLAANAHVCYLYGASNATWDRTQ
jgi:hypothetical protein